VHGVLAATDIAVDANWVMGLLLAMTRVAAFVTASPLLAKAMPRTAHLAVIVSCGFFLARPVEGDLDLALLVTASFTNVAVGVVLGFLSGMLFQLFAVAGGLLDLNSGLSIAAVFDPINNQPEAVFGRLFTQTALCVFVVTGGLHLFVIGLAQSVHAVPLDGTIDMRDGFIRVVASILPQLVIAGIELGMPALAALFITEVVLGIAARFAPQANVFLIGLPLKLLVAISTAGIVLLLIPTYVQGVSGQMLETFDDALRSIAGS
jgi:flagellar biosynthetic protein FliR